MHQRGLTTLTLVMAIAVSACTPTTAPETTSANVPDLSTTTTASTSTTPGQSIHVPEGWVSVDDPLVFAARASKSLDSVANAFDGSVNTSWVSGAEAPQWIEFDLGAPMKVASVRLLVDQTPDGYTVHDITAGAHDVPGMLITTVEGETQISQWIEVAIDKEVQFIRITTTESPSWVAWGEIEIALAD